MLFHNYLTQSIAHPTRYLL